MNLRSRAVHQFSLALLLLGLGPQAQPSSPVETAVEHALEHARASYVCPMHPKVVRDEPGECPLCGMDLVRVEVPPEAALPGPAPHGSHEPPVVRVPAGVVSRLGVRTAQVTRGSVARVIETVGYVTGAVYSAGAGLPPGLGLVPPGPGPGPDQTLADAAAVAAPGEPLVAPVPRVTVSGEVFERYVPLLQEGTAAEFRVRYLPGEVWRGRVEWVDQEVDPVKRTLLFNLEVDDPDEVLKSNMRGDLTLFLDPRADVLVIPREAVIRTGQGARVVVALGDGRFQPRAVVTGIEAGDRVAVLSGLREGEEVVASAQFLLDSEASLRAGLQRLGEEPGEEAAAESPR